MILLHSHILENTIDNWYHIVTIGIQDEFTIVGAWIVKHRYV